MAPTVWWYMNTTIPTLQKREGRRQGSDVSPKKFVGTWDEFELVLAGNSTGHQGIVKIYYNGQYFHHYINYQFE